MKYLSCFAAGFLMVMGPQADAEEQFPPCIPLNETLSICTDIDGLDVAFVGATETSAMGIVEPHSIEDITFVWAVYWSIDPSLDEFASVEVQALAKQESEYELQDPVSAVIEGFPGIRYDLLRGEGGSRELPPKSLLFLDTGGEIAVLYGEAHLPDVHAEDVFLGVRNAARILKKAE